MQRKEDIENMARAALEDWAKGQSLWTVLIQIMTWAYELGRSDQMEFR